MEKNCLKKSFRYIETVRNSTCLALFRFLRGAANLLRRRWTVLRGATSIEVASWSSSWPGQEIGRPSCHLQGESWEVVAILPLGYSWQRPPDWRRRPAAWRPTPWRHQSYAPWEPLPKGPALGAPPSYARSTSEACSTALPGRNRPAAGCRSHPRALGGLPGGAWALWQSVLRRLARGACWGTSKTSWMRSRPRSSQCSDSRTGWHPAERRSSHRAAYLSFQRNEMECKHNEASYRGALGRCRPPTLSPHS